MHIYVDCTETYVTRLNTGIQRVVKKIAQFESQNSEVKITSVVFDGWGIVQINPNVLNKAVVWLKIYRLVKGTPIFPFAKYIFYKGNQLIGFLKKIIPGHYLSLKSGDILLVADIIRNENYIKKLQELKSHGVTIYQIAFDILPITYPQFFRSPDSDRFKLYLSLQKTYCSKVFAISKKVANELKDKVGFDNVDYFHLGADFTDSSAPTKSVETVFPADSYYLAVGTLEPRKNHEHILKTFFKLWDEGHDKKLVFIGRLGWKFEKLKPLIKTAQEQYREHFLWLDNADDEELSSYYKNARAIVCASHDEGFGLPIIEALCQGKNVLCNDIEVFREVGGKHASYFNTQINGEDSLSEIIIKDNYQKDLNNYKWMTWSESINQLILKISNEEEKKHSTFG